MKIAVEGCCHGELDKIYETIAFMEQKDNLKVDLLLICGDFQSVRNRSDLKAMAVPGKYQKMNTFYKYFSGEAKAPVLTVFIGGNHEASNYLQELPYGGWVAPNIYYMGYANVIRFGGVRIGGISGIFKARDYMKGHFEHPPYNNDTIRSAYHTRNLDVFRLKQITSDIDIMLSHDWPLGIYNYGDKDQLVRKKKFLLDEVKEDKLGSPPLKELLHHMQPHYWFSAHLHVKFAAHVQHPQPSSDSQPKTTKFLSLDKCLPRRQFLQILDLPHDDSKSLKLELDPEWLQVLKSTNCLMNVTRSHTYLPGIVTTSSHRRYDFTPTEEELKELDADFQGMYTVPENFAQTAPTHTTQKKTPVPDPQININPQTTLLCEMLGLTDPFAVFSGKQSTEEYVSSEAVTQASQLDDSAVADDTTLSSTDSDDDEPPSFINSTFETSMNTTNNPDEIQLEEDDEQLSPENREVADEAPLDDLSAVEKKSDSESLDNVVAEVRKESSASEAFDQPKLEAQFFLNTDKSEDDSDADVKGSGVSGMSPPLTSSSTKSSSPAGARRSSDEMSEATDSPHRAKKFKRRNQACYTSTEEEN